MYSYVQQISPCAVLCCALVSTAAHLLLIFSRPSSALPISPRCCKHPLPVIARGPPARFAYLGKLAHRRGAIRRHDSWLASYGNTSSYSRAVQSASQSVYSYGVTGDQMDYEAQHRSRLLISLFVLLPIPIPFTTSCKSANPCGSSSPFVLFPVCCGVSWRGRKLLGLVL